MGGKVWSREEERVYWRIIVPQSVKRVGPSPIQTKSWEDLAIVMQSTLRSDAKRTYTGLGLFEHYFQNVDKGRVSPNGAKYVIEHKMALRQAIEDEEETEIEDSEADEETSASNEEVMSAEIYEDKENQPIHVSRTPLAPVQGHSPVQNNAEVADMGRYGNAHTDIQFATSAERTTLHTLNDLPESQPPRSPSPRSQPPRRQSHRNDFRAHPYKKPGTRLQSTLSYRPRRSSARVQSPAQVHGYEEPPMAREAGRQYASPPMESHAYGAMPTAYGAVQHHTLPPMQAHGYGIQPMQHHHNNAANQFHLHPSQPMSNYEMSYNSYGSPRGHQNSPFAGPNTARPVMQSYPYNAAQAALESYEAVARGLERVPQQATQQASQPATQEASTPMTNSPQPARLNNDPIPDYILPPISQVLRAQQTPEHQNRPQPQQTNRRLAYLHAHQNHSAGEASGEPTLTQQEAAQVNAARQTPGVPANLANWFAVAMNPNHQ